MGTNTIEVTKDNFAAEVLQSAVPVVIDFWAPWCGPCRMIGPVLDDLAARYAGKVKVAKVNVDHQRELASAFMIQGIPALKIVNDGKLTGEMVGFRGRGPIEALFAELTKDKEAA